MMLEESKSPLKSPLTSRMRRKPSKKSLVKSRLSSEPKMIDMRPGAELVKK